MIMCEELRILSDKIGRNDPCPCGSGLKYKKCCMKNDEKIKHKQQQETKPDVDRKIHTSTFATKQEIMDSIHDDGLIPVVVDEGVHDGLYGKAFYIEIDEVCKHGVCEESQTFELIKGEWECVETNSFMDHCVICEGLKEGIIVCCSRCGEELPDLSEEECIRVYADELFSNILLTTACPSCGSPWVNIPYNP